MQTLIKVSDAVNLAMHASAILASRPSYLISAKELAARLGASEATLSKAMQRLVRAGLISSTRGPAGGFRLARAPETIALKAIVEAIEGPLSIPGCLFGHAICQRDDCILGDALAAAHDLLFQRLEKTTLDEVSIAFVRQPASTNGETGSIGTKRS